MTAAVLTLDTAVDERRKMADRVARSPARLCNRDGMLLFFVLLRPYSSHRLLFSKYGRVILVTFVVVSHLRIPLVFIQSIFHFIARIFLVGVFVLSYPLRWHLICLRRMIKSRLYLACYLSQSDHIICTSLG